MHLPAQGAVLERGQREAESIEEEDQRDTDLVEQFRVQEAALGPRRRPDECQGNGDQHAFEKPVKFEFHGV